MYRWIFAHTDQYYAFPHPMAPRVGPTTPRLLGLSLSLAADSPHPPLYILPLASPPATLSTYLISSHTKNNQSKVPNHHDDDELVVSYTDLVPATR